MKYLDSYVMVCGMAFEKLVEVCEREAEICNVICCVVDDL